ncbi:MAG: RNA polymerase sigma factor [Thermomonas sp.]|uniref:RNA polymerase sigma factor n=1 Tax=Thermomonas sp. TaxID=1971895 RepID=UPI001EBB4280|nr:RNA polymerase sigma factor [Thermomonas sp.]MBV2209668.1 RNA polymerase sigma factor [Thermomonas sp.]
MENIIDQWFIRDILIHEAALTRLLQRHWPQRDEIHDLRQEVYARTYEAAAKGFPSNPKAFLFACARNLMTDRLRRSKVVSIEPMGDFEPSHVLLDEVSPERWCGGRQALHHLSAAFDQLPDRCREVVWLRRVEELSQKEVARRLGISEKTVEKHIAKGMRLLADALYGTPESPLHSALLDESRDAQRHAD